MVGEEGDKNAVDSNFQANKLRVENWEEQVFLHSSPNSHSSIDVKQEDSASSYVYSHANTGDNYHSSATKSSNWAPVVSASSPKSCVTSLSTGVLDFSSKKTDGRHPPPDRTSEVATQAYWIYEVRFAFLWVMKYTRVVCQGLSIHAINISVYRPRV